MIIRHSAFKSDPWGDGGARRTAQIGEILSSSGCDEFFIERPAEARRLTSLTGLLRDSGFLVKSGVPLRPSIDLLANLGNDLRFFRRQFERFPLGSLLLWEATQPRFAHVPFMAKECGLKVIGLPHNLESLVPGNRSFCTGKVAPQWLAEEMRSLASCDKVFAISREDQWLLRLHGITADYLPYFPPAAVVDAMLKIREARRAAKSGNDLLLMGTAANRPTFSGMADRLEFFAGHADAYGTLHVAGYGTERLRTFLPSNIKIILHGAVDNQQLHSLLTSVRAAIIHQVPTSGALTRIPELLLAGVPVLANTDAARSHFCTQGVYVYEDDAQLLTMLTGSLAAFEVPPPSPVSLSTNFLSAVKELSAGGNPSSPVV